MESWWLGVQRVPSKCSVCIAATLQYAESPWAQERRKADGALKGDHCPPSLPAAFSFFLLFLDKGYGF